MRFTAKDIALVAVMVALLIGGQLALSAVAGVEIVTVLLLCFSYTFGVKRGVFAATAFSLLRCLIWGFYPAVVVLYLVYYNAFALLFGLMGERNQRLSIKKTSAFLVILTELLFVLLFIPCFFILTERIKVSILLLDGLKTLSWFIISFNTLFFIAYNVLLIFGKKSPKLSAWKIIFSVTATAAVCTVCFTLLDDVITPLFYGFTPQAALAYFYTSFTAMIPQTLCAVVTVSLLFYPLTKIFSQATKSIVK